MDGVVVVDTSLAFKWFVLEEDSNRARALGRSWSASGVRIAAPHLVLAEMSNVLHRMVVEDDFPVRDAVSLIGQVSAFGLELHHALPLYPRALELASILRQGAVYDCVFLALAESFNCDLWTADARFQRAARGQYANVHLLSEFQPLA